MNRRLVVFIDYQNTYRSARRAFGFDDSPDHWEGQVHPRTVGELICRRYTDAPTDLKDVRVYRGMPSGTHDRKGYAAAQRQTSIWTKTTLVSVITRPLRYPHNYPTDPPEEKGIDVMIALDYVTMAVRGEYDLGVLFSGDTDLVPALEQVITLGTVTSEVAAWNPGAGSGARLRPPGQNIRCHWLDQVDYEAVRDGRDYNIKS